MESTWGFLLLLLWKRKNFREEIVTEPHLDNEEEGEEEGSHEVEEDHSAVASVAGVLEKAAEEAAEKHQIDLKWVLKKSKRHGSLPLKEPLVILESYF